MTLEYSLTYDDYRETQRAYAATRRTRRGWAVLAVGLTLLGLGIASVVYGRASPPSPAGRSPAASAGDLVRMLLPFAVFPLLLLTVVRLPVSRSAAAYVDVSARMRRPVPLTAVNLAVQVALVVVAVFPAAPSDRGPSDPAATPLDRAVGVALPLVPVAVGLPFVLVLAGVVRRRTFAAQPNLRLPRTAEVTPDDVTFDNGLTRTTYRPLAVVRLVETPRLFLLGPSFVTFEIVPKRAFGSAEDVAEFRRLVAGWATRRTNAFPVVGTRAAGLDASHGPA